MSDLTTLIQKVDDLQADVTVIVTRYDEVLNATQNVVINVNSEIQKAKDWAQCSRGTLVPSGNGVDEFSAYHWALEAADNAASTVSAAADAAAAVAAKEAAEAILATTQVSEAAALTYRNDAQVSATVASSQATSAADSATASAADRVAIATVLTQINDMAGTVAADRLAVATAAENVAIAEGDALTHAGVASTAAVLARRWASAPEDEIVENGLFSAYHYSQKCLQIFSSLNISDKLGRTEQAADSALLNGEPPNFYLAWQNITGKPLTFPPLPHAHIFSDMSDVNLTGVAEGDLLQKVGAVWVARSLANAGISEIGHSHSWEQITGKPSSLAGYGVIDVYTKAEVDAAIQGAAPNWDSLVGKPLVFSPSPHTHVEADIIGLDKYTKAEVDSLIASVAVDWGSLSGKPTTLVGFGITDPEVTSLTIGGWSVSENNGDLVFSKGGNKVRLTDAGAVIAKADVTASGVV